MQHRIFLAFSMLWLQLMVAVAQPVPSQQLTTKVNSAPFMPHQNDSRFYRIPAMVVAADGSIVVMADKRYDSNADLGNHRIDVVVRRSTDGGKTWSPQHTVVAGDGESNEMFGVGDPALVRTRSGKLVCLMAAGKANFWQGLRHIRMTTSSDNGKTWTPSVDITTPSRFTDAATGSHQLDVFSLFVTSGRGICTPSGRLMFLVVIRQKTGDKPTNVNRLLYSDDEGKTWTLGKEIVYPQADEAKLAVLDNGDVLASVRRKGERGFNTADATGQHWGTPLKNSSLVGNACNADIINVGNGLLLHTLLADVEKRRDLRLYASSDNAQTWQPIGVIRSAEAGYSTMELLPDGSLAILYEEGQPGAEEYTLRFVTIAKENFRVGE